jgi:hypothetical protein
MVGLIDKLSSLPPVLEFAGEFGAEVNTFIPFVYFLYRTGLMDGRQIATYRGMRPYYFFLSADQYTERVQDRSFIHPSQRPEWLPNRDDHRSIRQADEWFPDYRSIYCTEFGFDKPILLIHNKYSAEWGGAPVNFIPTEVLNSLLTMLEDEYQVIYFPIQMAKIPINDFAEDHQETQFLDDLPILAAHPKVVNFTDILTSRPQESYNEVKLRLFASAYHYLIVQGGNVHLSSLFSGNVTVVLHVAGSETAHSYAKGHFQYASNPRPKLLICRRLSELTTASGVLRCSKVVENQAHISDAGLELLRRYAPTVQT